VTIAECWCAPSREVVADQSEFLVRNQYAKRFRLLVFMWMFGFSAIDQYIGALFSVSLNPAVH
jgi:hypothetical protein